MGSVAEPICDPSWVNEAECGKTENWDFSIIILLMFQGLKGHLNHPCRVHPYEVMEGQRSCQTAFTEVHIGEIQAVKFEAHYVSIHICTLKCI